MNMQDDFTERFAGLAADADYSRHRSLQGFSKEDIKAAAHALWTYAMRQDSDLSGLDETMVIAAMSARTRRWDDEGKLVSLEFEGYWDATDEMNFSSLLLKDMARELSAKHLAEQRASHIVVNNRDGIWLFDRDGIAAAAQGI